MLTLQQEGEKRKAELLSIAIRQGQTKFYVHYEDFNKRLDEWIAADRIDLSREVEWPAPEKADKKKNIASKADKAPSKSDQKNLKRSRSKLDREISGTPESTSSNVPGKAQRPSKASGKENQEVLVTSEVTDGTPKPEDEEMDLDEEDIGDSEEEEEEEEVPKPKKAKAKPKARATRARGRV